MDFNITQYRKGQEKAISSLVKKVYDEFVAPDYTEQGNQFFYNWIDPENIAQRQQEEISLFVATISEKIVGMIEIRDKNHISLLFVDTAYQRKGIANELLKSALNNCRLNDKSLDKFYVHASPFSVPIYERLGFKATSEMKEEKGITYLPMEK